MTPQQKVGLDAKQSLQRVEQLASWLDRNKVVVGGPVFGLKESLKMLATRYRNVEQAIDAPPAIAVIGEAGGLRAKLVGALTQSAGVLGEHHAHQDEMERLRQIIGRTTNGDLCAAVRFRGAVVPSTPRGSPVRFALLGFADIAALMVKVHQTVWPSVAAHRGLLDRLAAVQLEISSKVQIATLPGLSETDVLRLRDMVERHYPGSATLNQLAAAGYWGDLAEVAAHIPDGDRVRALSLLWAEHPEVTALFRHLVEGLAEVGYASEVFADSSAVVDRDGETGWLVAHGESVISARTLARLGEDKGSTLRVVGRYGHPSSLSRPVIAALVSEITLASPAFAIPSHAPVDIVDFPMLALPCDLDLGLLPVEGGLTQRQLADVYAHAKTLYLIDHACRSRDVTSLVACVDPTSETMDVLAGPIGDWIDVAQGTDAEKRERCHTSLFAISASGDGDGCSWDEGIPDAGGATVDAIAGEGTWIREWTPGQAFSNSYRLELDHSEGDAHRAVRSAGRGRKGRTPIGQGREVIEGARNRTLGSMGPVATAVSTRQQAQQLVEKIVSVSLPQVKQRQLRRELAELHTRVRARFLRLSGEGEAVDRGDWRQRIAAVLNHRIQRVARQRKLGLLLDAIAIEEAELLAVYDRSDYAALDGRMKVPARAIAELEHAFPDETIAREATVPRALSIGLAERAVGQWLAAMRRVARSGRLCREIGISETLLEHLVDELGLGAARLGLVRRVGEVIEIDVVRAHGGRYAFAGSVAAVLNGFLERLDIDGGRRHGGGDGVVRPAFVGLDHGDGASHFGVSSGEETVAFSDRWRAALSTLVEANIANARFWSVGETAADLSRILSEFPQSRFEVEL